MAVSALAPKAAPPSLTLAALISASAQQLALDSRTNVRYNERCQACPDALKRIIPVGGNIRRAISGYFFCNPPEHAAVCGNKETDTLPHSGRVSLHSERNKTSVILLRWLTRI